MRCAVAAAAKWRWRWLGWEGWEGKGPGSSISDRGNWIIYGNINTYRAFTEDWAAPISSMDFLQEEGAEAKESKKHI